MSENAAARLRHGQCLKFATHWSHIKANVASQWRKRETGSLASSCPNPFVNFLLIRSGGWIVSAWLLSVTLRMILCPAQMKVRGGGVTVKQNTTTIFFFWNNNWNFWISLMCSTTFVHCCQLSWIFVTIYIYMFCFHPFCIGARHVTIYCTSINHDTNLHRFFFKRLNHESTVMNWIDSRVRWNVL